jgi:hypothetical protein
MDDKAGGGDVVDTVEEMSERSSGVCKPWYDLKGRQEKSVSLL